MREGRREKRSRYGAKETHSQSPSPCEALEIRSHLRGQGLPGSLPCSPRAWRLHVPRRGGKGRGCSEQPCTDVFSPNHTHTSASPKNPKGTPCPTWLAAPECSQQQLEEEGKVDGCPACTRPGTIRMW